MSKRFNRLDVNFGRTLADCNPLKDDLRESMSFTDKQPQKTQPNTRAMYCSDRKAQCGSLEKNKFKFDVVKKLRFFF